RDVRGVQASAQRRRQEEAAGAEEARRRRSVALAESVVPAVSAPLPLGARDEARVQELRGARLRADAELPMVRQDAAARSIRNGLPVEVPALPPGDEARLALLPVLLRAGLRRRDDSPVQGPPLLDHLREREVPWPADALHALLPVVPAESEAPVEAAVQHGPLPV